MKLLPDRSFGEERNDSEADSLVKFELLSFIVDLFECRYNALLEDH